MATKWEKSPYSKVSKRRTKQAEKARCEPVRVRALERTLSMLRAAYAAREAELLYATSLLNLEDPKARTLICGLARRIREDPFLRSAVGHPAKVDTYLSVFQEEKASSKAQAHAAMAEVLEALELRPERADDVDMQLLLSFPTADLKPDLKDKSKMEFYPAAPAKDGDGTKDEMEFDTSVPPIRVEIRTHAKLVRESARVKVRQGKLKKANIEEMRKHDGTTQGELRKSVEGKTQEEVRLEVKERQGKRVVPLERQVFNVTKRV